MADLYKKFSEAVKMISFAEKYLQEHRVDWRKETSEDPKEL